ncbi:hypothetical protein B0H15DRAFT_807124 [Mycena belliarum]|uniref:Uncharacterized protein n=1 Tax=Mycena belliarum TaxID=1033014 RepID=A0AAD6TMZ6_9AGAR|nr:hypothetical protein B0H15DRAFT_807124 [Mycena belliae]
MNQSQTGYKLRKHIAKALQARSKALSWEQVVESPIPPMDTAYRLALDKYFRLQRAKEEIRRLNIKIRRVVTWIHDEDRLLRRKGRELRRSQGKSAEQAEADLNLAVQVRLYRERRGRFDDAHMRRFRVLAKTAGFTGSILPGRAVEVVQGIDEMEVDNKGNETGSQSEQGVAGEGDDEDEGDDTRDTEVSRIRYRLSVLAVDGAREEGDGV